jgi:2-methylcitrate dehydratase PrpD
MAGGLLEFLTDGSSAKRMHGGWAAHGGIVAARLAREGLSGPAGGLDGRFGLLTALLGDRGDPARAVEELGSRWELLDIALKPYPCCHFLHAFLDAAAELREELGAPGDAPAALLSRIARIECGVPPPVIPVVCEPLPTKRRPQTPYDAQFSLPFTVSVMLARGRLTLADFDEASIRSGELLALAERVTIVPEPRDDFPERFPGRLRLHLTDGRRLEAERADNRGGPSAPLRRDEVEAKFRANVADLLDEAGADQVVRRVWGATMSRPREIMSSFRGSGADTTERLR